MPTRDLRAGSALPAEAQAAAGDQEGRHALRWILQSRCGPHPGITGSLPDPCQTVTAVDGYRNPQSKRFGEPLLLPRIRPLCAA
jgi:hypothetical protein